MSDQPQSFANHAKMVPLYHYFTFSAVLFPTLYFGYLAVTDFSVERVVLFIFGTGVIMSTFFARVFPLGVQDRVIRLEERMRLRRILPEDLHGRISTITTRQLIALRFASDAEVPDLVGRVFDGEFSDAKAIKAAIKTWRPDHQRI